MYSLKLYRLEQMFDYGGGGGGGSSSSPARYFYLVFNSGQATKALDETDIQSFFRSGVNTSSDYAFVFVDIGTDLRLKEDLLKLENGADFHQRLEGSVPAFLITYASIANCVSADAIKLFPVQDYKKDVAIIYHEMGLDAPDARKAFVAFLRKMNSYAQLKPNIFGLGANLNEMIADLINRLERTSP